jgi:hypothetical protein
MQSIMGALLTAGYASAIATAIAGSPDQKLVTDNVQQELEKSFASAAQTAQRYPRHSEQIITAARESFVDGQKWAYTAGLIAVLVGAVVVWFMFPKHDDELALLAQYRAEDTAPATV